MNEILESEYRLRDNEKEKELFNALVKARNVFFEGARKQVKGEISKAELNQLHANELKAFEEYINHRNITIDV